VHGVAMPQVQRGPIGLNPSHRITRSSRLSEKPPSATSGRRARLAPSPACPVVEIPSPSVDNRQMPELRRATTALFPDVSATLAYRLLFATYTAVVPDGVDDLSVEGLDWAGDGVVLLERLRAQIGAGNRVTSLPRQPAPGTIGSCS
jgi:hypothetical protein